MPKTSRQSVASPADRDFVAEFAAGKVPGNQFDHRAHLRLAYVYLCEGDVDSAAERMRSSLLAYLAHLGVDPIKYHQTITRAWVLAIQHFIDRSKPFDSFDAFITTNPQLLDPKIMLSHYSAAVLFGDEARTRFVAPDIQTIPPPTAADTRQK